VFELEPTSGPDRLSIHIQTRSEEVPAETFSLDFEEVVLYSQAQVEIDSFWAPAEMWFLFFSRASWEMGETSTLFQSRKICLQDVLRK